MNKATALGFWAKNPLIMDKLYELDDWQQVIDGASGLPSELVALAKENKSLLADLIESAEPAEDDVFRKLYMKLRESLEATGAKITKKKQGANWDYKVTVMTHDRRQTRARALQFGWGWHTEGDRASLNNQAMYLDTWVWTKGGKGSEQKLLERFKKFKIQALEAMLAARDIRDFSWIAGTIRLNRINVSERVKDDFSIDLDALVADVWKSFAWINKARLDELFRLQ